MYLFLWIVGSLLIAEAFTQPSNYNETNSRAGGTDCYSCATSSKNTELVQCGSEYELRIVTCPDERPVCYSVAKVIPGEWVVDNNYYIGCGPDTGKDTSFTLETDPVSNIKSIVYQCTEPMCNRPIYRIFLAEVKGALKDDPNATLIKVSRTFNAMFYNIGFTDFNKDPMMNVLLNRTAIVLNRRTRSPITTIKPILNGTMETIKAEPLKQQPPASEDDEDDGEGSGLSEDLKNHRRLASSPSDPSSFLPAKENRGYYCKAPNILVMVMSITILV